MSFDFRVLFLILFNVLRVIVSQDPETTTPTIETSSVVSSTTDAISSTSSTASTPAFNVTQFPTLYCKTSGLIGIMSNPSDATCKT